MGQKVYFNSDGVEPHVSMQGLRNLSFFLTKKKPAPNGEEDGRIMPTLKGLVNVVLHGFPFLAGKIEKAAWPGRRLMGQSYG